MQTPSPSCTGYRRGDRFTMAQMSQRFTGVATTTLSVSWASDQGSTIQPRSTSEYTSQR